MIGTTPGRITIVSLAYRKRAESWALRRAQRHTDEAEPPRLSRRSWRIGWRSQ